MFVFAALQGNFMLLSFIYVKYEAGKKLCIGNSHCILLEVKYLHVGQLELRAGWCLLSPVVTLSRHFHIHDSWKSTASTTLEVAWLHSRRIREPPLAFVQI